MPTDGIYTAAALLTRPSVFRRKQTVRWLLGYYLAAANHAAGAETRLPEDVLLYLMKWLFAAARTPARGFPVLTASTGRYFDSRWTEIQADDYGNFIAPLLPLAHRSSDAQLICQVEALVIRLLHSPELTPAARRVFAVTSQSLLDNGAWVDRQRGEEVLVRLGVTIRDDAASVELNRHAGRTGVLETVAGA